MKHLKAHANNVLLWLQISAVSYESNSTAELTLMWMYVALYSKLYDGGARTAADRMCAARYYDISSKADRGDIFSVHDQKSSYRTPLVGGRLSFLSFPSFPSVLNRL